MAMTYGDPPAAVRTGRERRGRHASGPARRGARASRDVWVSDHVVHPAEQSYPVAVPARSVRHAVTWAAAVTERVRPGHERARGAPAQPGVAGQPPGQRRRHERRPADRRRRGGLERSGSTRRSGSRSATGASGWTRSSTCCGRRGATTRRPSTASTYSLRRHPVPAQARARDPDLDRRRASRPPSGGPSRRATASTSSASSRRRWRPIVERLRRDRPEPTFTISARTGWDPQGMDPGVIRGARTLRSRRPGCSTWSRRRGRRTSDAWLRSMDLLAEIVRPDPSGLKGAL